MKCCDVPNPCSSCTPKESFINVVSCDNLKGAPKADPLTCMYTRVVGVEMSSRKSVTSFTMSEVSRSVGFGAGIGLGPLSANVMKSLGNSKATGTDWGQANRKTYKTQTTSRSTITVPPGTKVILEQVVAYCGFYEVRSLNLRKTDIKTVVRSETFSESVRKNGSHILTKNLHTFLER